MNGSQLPQGSPMPRMWHHPAPVSGGTVAAHPAEPVAQPITARRAPLGHRAAVYLALASTRGSPEW
jgi:hypothetical protein